MSKTQNIISQSAPINTKQFFINNSNYNHNSFFKNPDYFESKNPSLTGKIPRIFQKRTYNDLMESYRINKNNLYKQENDGLYKAINKNFQKKLKNVEQNSQNIDNLKEDIILCDKKNKIENKKKEIINPKKFFVDDSLDDVEKDFVFEKDKKVEKKYRLSKSYLYDEEPGFYSDLEDTKENSFSSLNFSFDYPEIHFDNKIKDKLITNAIELEKTFNRFFNVKNMPNKK